MVPSCGANTKLNPYRTYHKIPDAKSNASRRAEWLKALNFTEDELQIIQKSLSKPPCVCSVHFADKFIRKQNFNPPTERLNSDGNKWKLLVKTEPNKILDECQKTGALPKCLLDEKSGEIVRFENEIMKFNNPAIGTKRKSNEAQLSQNEILNKKVRIKSIGTSEEINPHHHLMKLHQTKSEFPQAQSLTQHNLQNHQSQFIQRFPAPFIAGSSNYETSSSITSSAFQLPLPHYIPKPPSSNFDPLLPNYREFGQHFPMNKNSFQPIPLDLNTPTTSTDPGLTNQVHRPQPRQLAGIHHPQINTINDNLNIELPSIKAYLESSTDVRGPLIMGDPTAQFNGVRRVSDGFVLQLALQVPIKFVDKKV